MQTRFLVTAATSLMLLGMPAAINAAPLPAPIGHRQPTASDVPSDDTHVGSGGLGEGRSAGNSGSSGSRGGDAIHDGLGFPDICSNCND